MNRLTKQEQLVLCVVFGLLLLGWAVKAWRTAHPPHDRPGDGQTIAASAEQEKN